MRRSWFWAKPWFLWTMSVVLPLAVVPLSIYSGDLYYAEGGTSPDGPGMFTGALIAISPLWGGVWLVIVTSFLARYRGSATLLPIFGHDQLARVLAVIAILASCFFIWIAFAWVESEKLNRLPFVLFWLAVAIHFQLLRAAAVRRSVPEPAESPETLI